MDKGNLNRSFPGDPNGSVTPQIADYFTRVLVPMSDVVLDLHSGGRTLDILPFGASHVLDNKEQQQAALEGAKAFGAPYAMVMFELDSEKLFDTACERQGKVFVATELGGGGTSTPQSIAIAERGVRNFLIHYGLIAGKVEMPTGGQLYLDMPDASCYVQSQHSGVLELLVALGDEVKKGQTIAYVYDMTRSGTDPVAYKAERDGILMARRAPSLINMGDTLAVIADVVERLEA
jgi:N-alpha-acetyl-L-2,4-diaminobutyrate deacetylase